MQFSVEHHEWNCNDVLHIRWLQPHATAQFEYSFVHMPLKILGNFHFYGFQDKMLFSNVIQMENVPMNEFIGFIGDRIDVVFVVNFEMPTSQWNESAPHSTDIQTLCSSTNNHIIMIDWIIKSVAHFMSETSINPLNYCQKCWKVKNVCKARICDDRMCIINVTTAIEKTKASKGDRKMRRFFVWVCVCVCVVHRTIWHGFIVAGNGCLGVYLVWC